MFDDLKQWCEEGRLYLKCIARSELWSESVLCEVGQEYTVYEVAEDALNNTNYWLFINTGSSGFDMCIGWNDADFEYVVKENGYGG